MKRIVLAMALTAMLCLVVGCSSNGGSTPKTSGSTTSAVAQSASALPERNGFDEATNKSVELYGVAFQMPSYFSGPTSKERVDLYSAQLEDGTSDSAIAMFCSVGTKAASKERFLKNQKDALLSVLQANKTLKDVKIEKTETMSIADLPSGVYTLSGNYIYNNKAYPFKARGCIYLNAVLDIGVVYFIELAGAKYGYLSDFDKVLASATVVEQPAASDGVSTDLKEMLDSYEAFIDEYIAFMEKYKNSDDITSMLADYATYMKKYSELVGKINALDTSTMSAADAAYYFEVTTRVSQKLLSAAV